MIFNHDRMLELLFNKIRFKGSYVFNQSRCSEDCKFFDDGKCKLFFEDCAKNNGEHIRCKGCKETFDTSGE